MSKPKPFDDVLDSCPNCGAMWGSEEIGLGRCFACGYVEGDNPDYEEDDDEETQALEKAAFGGHEDVWIEIDGKQQRVLGDPNMSEETKKALAAMIKAATEVVERGDFDDDEDEPPEGHVLCINCNGRGRVDGDKWCNYCNGEGFVPARYSWGDDHE